MVTFSLSVGLGFFLMIVIGATQALGLSLDDLLNAGGELTTALERMIGF
jgi:hypothetical protein